MGADKTMTKPETHFTRLVREALRVDDLPVQQSAGGLQSRDREGEQASDRCLRAGLTGRGQGVQAVAGELVGGHVVTHGATFGGGGDEVSHHVVQLPLSAGDALAAVEERGELAVRVAVGIVDDEGVGLEDGFEAGLSIGGSVARPPELVQVVTDLTVVPGEKDRLDVREVLVERGASDAGVLGDPRHRDRQWTFGGHQASGGGDDGIPHIAAVCLDGVAPQLRHTAIIRHDDAVTNCIDIDTMYR